MGIFDALSSFLKSPPPPERKRSEKMKPREWKREPERHLHKELKPLIGAYEPEPSEHPLALRYQPKLTGRGGEHLVFEVAGSPDVVVKVEKTAIVQALLWNAGHGLPLGSESEELGQEQEKRVKEQRRLFTLLKKHFGAEHVLPQKKTLMKVPLTIGLRRELRQMLKDRRQEGVEIPSDLKEITTIVTVQRRAEPLVGVRYSPLCAGAVEKREFGKILKEEGFRDSYREVTNPLMSAETAERMPFDEEALIKLLQVHEFAQLVDKANADPGLRRALKDFCARAITFAEETGEIIDLVGVDNVIFSKKPDGSWTYLLIDPLYGFKPRVLEKGHAAYLKAEITGSIEDEFQNDFLHGVIFTRAINGLSKIVGSKKFYDFLPADHDTPPDVLGALHPSLKRLDRSTASKAA